MLCLGIESTAHSFGAGIVSSEGEILANARHTYSPPAGKGIVPWEAAARHAEYAARVIERAVQEARTKEPRFELKGVDLIAFSRGPGLPPCLRVGAVVARTLALKWGRPLIDVNHAVAHIEIGRLTTSARDPVVLYVSGGNTQVLALVERRYRVFGETLDIPIGNALDQFAREAGLGFPGGPKIEEVAKGGSYLELPYSVKGMDLSFAGLVTAAVRQLKAGKRLEDVALSLQETAFAMLVEVTERALAHVGKSEVLVVGGVAANARFTQMLDIMCRERGAQAFAVPQEYSGDNGAMIAWTGLLAHRPALYNRELALAKAIDQRWRADEVEVTWA